MSYFMDHKHQEVGPGTQSQCMYYISRAESQHPLLSNMWKSFLQFMFQTLSRLLSPGTIPAGQHTIPSLTTSKSSDKRFQILHLNFFFPS